jgi:hypothetical protein
MHAAACCSSSSRTVASQQQLLAVHQLCCLTLHAVYNVSLTSKSAVAPSISCKSLICVVCCTCRCMLRPAHLQQHKAHTLGGHPHPRPPCSAVSWHAAALRVALDICCLQGPTWQQHCHQQPSSQQQPHAYAAPMPIHQQHADSLPSLAA